MLVFFHFFIFILVFEILLKVSNGESWAQALPGAVPARFFEAATVKNDEQENDVTETAPAENQDSDTEMHSADETNSCSTPVESPETTENISTE